MAVGEWYKRLQEESRQFMEENQRQWDERQRQWEEQRRIESQIAQQERDRRFYRTINELRGQMGLPPISCPCETIAEEGRSQQTIETTADPHQEASSETSQSFKILRDLNRGMSPNDQKHQEHPLIGVTVEEVEELKSQNSEKSDEQEITEPSPEVDEDSNLMELQIQFESSKDSSRMTDQDSQGCNDPTISWGINVGCPETSIGDPRHALDENSDNFKVQFERSEVNSDLLMIVIVEGSKEMVRFNGVLDEQIEIGDAYQVFGKMPLRGIRISVSPIQSGNTHSCQFSIIFDPGGSFDVKDWEINECKAISRVLSKQFGHFTQVCLKFMPIGRGRVGLEEAMLGDVQALKHGLSVTFIFDPGGGSIGRVINAEMLSDKVVCNAIKDGVCQNSRLMNKEENSFPFDRGKAPMILPLRGISLLLQVKFEGTSLTCFEGRMVAVIRRLRKNEAEDGAPFNFAYPVWK